MAGTLDKIIEILIIPILIGFMIYLFRKPLSDLYHLVKRAIDSGKERYGSQDNQQSYERFQRRPYEIDYT